MLADHARSLDALIEAAKELIEALSIAEFNPHLLEITPPQGDVGGSSAICLATHQGQPCMIAGIAPATHGTGYRGHGLLTSRNAGLDNEFWRQSAFSA